MSFEPRGKVAVLMQAMRASPDKIVWPADEVATTMEVARGNLPAYLQAVVTRGLLHRKIEAGKSFFSLQPFPEAPRSTPGAGLEQKLIPSATYTANELEAKQQDARAPKFDTGWTPPKMIPTRGSASGARTLEDEGEELRARINGANDSLNEKLRAPRGEPQTELGKRTTSAATASSHEIPDSASTPEPAAAAGPEQERPTVANEGDAREASGGSAQVGEVIPGEEESEAGAAEFNAALWLDGDLDLYGLIETEDGAHRVPAAQVAKLRRLLAWMPA